MCYNTTMKCLICDNEVEGRGKTCSAACRVKLSRLSKKGDTPEIETPVVEHKDTPTDLLFEESHPGYYKFDNEVYARDCFSCGEAFTTRLELTKFCSPDCKNLLLSKFGSKK